MGGSCSSSSGSVYFLFCNNYVFAWACDSFTPKYKLETIALIVTLLFYYRLSWYCEGTLHVEKMRLLIRIRRGEEVQSKISRMRWKIDFDLHVWSQRILNLFKTQFSICKTQSRWEAGGRRGYPSCWQSSGSWLTTHLYSFKLFKFLKLRSWPTSPPPSPSWSP